MRFAMKWILCAALLGASVAWAQALDIIQLHHRGAAELLPQLAPFVERFPEAYGGLARVIVSDVVQYCKNAGETPDVELLERIARTLGSGSGAG